MKAKPYGFLLILLTFVVFSLTLANASEISHRPYSLGTYLWSEGLEKYSNKKIMQFIKIHNISEIAIPFKSYFNSEKTKQLANQLKAQHVKIELIISNPEYIFPDKWNKFKNKLVSIFKSGFNAHLDIEPHMLTDYKKNQNKYLRLFIELLKKSHNLAEGFEKKISVDINPMIFSGQFDEIINNSDNVILMIYGTKNIFKINSLVSPYKKAVFNNKKVYVALKAIDFRSLKELESFLQVLSNKIGIKAFFIQNFRNLLTLAKN